MEYGRQEAVALETQKSGEFHSTTRTRMKENWSWRETASEGETSEDKVTEGWNIEPHEKHEEEEIVSPKEFLHLLLPPQNLLQKPKRNPDANQKENEDP